jgi:RNA recognition motif
VLFFTGLSPNTSWRELREAIDAEIPGAVRYAALMTRMSDGLATGNATVICYTKDAAEDVIAQFDNRPFDGAPIRVQFDLVANRVANGSPVFISGIPISWRVSDIRDYFSKFGQVLRWDRSVTNYGGRLPYGKIVFAERDGAARCLDEMNGVEIDPGHAVRAVEFDSGYKHKKRSADQDRATAEVNESESF